MFKPVARKLLASEVFDQIRQRILSGEMAPGASLPAERVLASLLGVNRNAIREGLKRLQQAGLVAIQQGETTRVLDFKRTAGLEVLATMIVSEEGVVNTKIVRDVLELRSELAPIVGRLAAERAKRAHVVALRGIVEQMRAASDDTSVLVKLALDFWAEVVAATDNLALELAFNSVAVSYGSVLAQTHHVMGDEVRAIDDYAALVDAIDGKKAEKAGATAKRIVVRGEASIGRVTKVVDVFQRATRVGTKKESRT